MDNNNQVNLAAYTNPEYSHGAGIVKRMLWMCISAFFFQNPLSIFSGLLCFWLRLFGAKIGLGVVIRPGVHIKHPWMLNIGHHAWIGENVWIDNLAPVEIGDHVCISQGAMLLTGSHDYKKSTFDLITGSIELHEGVWIGARATVCPGVVCHSHSVLAVASVATQSLSAYGIYQGNPAVYKRKRFIEAK